VSIEIVFETHALTEDNERGIATAAGFDWREEGWEDRLG
jgi:hypothetical protein